LTLPRGQGYYATKDIDSGLSKTAWTCKTKQYNANRLEVLERVYVGLHCV